MEEAVEILKEKKALVFSGGGVLGIGQVGALSKLIDLGLSLKNITSVTGSSVGSIIATAVACGADINYIKNKMNSIDYNALQGDSCFLIQGIRLINRYGLHSTNGVRNLISDVLKDLIGNSDITFKELFDKTGVWLTITYLSLNYGRTIYADHVYEPDTLVREAVVKSSSIPIFYDAYFEKGTSNGKKQTFVSVDGGMMLNYPMVVPRLQNVNPRELLGLKFVSTGDVNVKDEGQPGTDAEDMGPPTNIITYLNNMIQILRKQAMKVHVSNNDWMLTVKINVGTLSSTDFSLTDAQKEWLFNQGQTSIDNYLQELTSLLEEGKFTF